MINKVVAAVCGVLDREFGHPVYTEPVAQGVDVPAFFVTADAVSLKRLLGERRRLDFTVNILYLPPQTERRRVEALETADKLCGLFRLLDVDGRLIHCFAARYDFSNLTRGFNRGYESSDEVLIFKFDAKIFLNESGEDADKMLYYNTQQEMK